MTEQEKQQLVDAVITQLKNEGTDVSSASVVEDVNGVSYVLCYDTNGNIVRVSPDTINQQESTNKDAIKANANNLAETKKDIANQLFAASTADKVSITGRNEQSMRINFSAEIPAATTEKAGVMTAGDKKKVNASIKNIDVNPNEDDVELDLEDNTEKTSHVVFPAATAERAGVMSAEDKVKLDNLSQGGVAELMEEVTYSELVALRDNASLVAGIKYRITDYVTTTVQKDTKSANHPFDVIVEAVSENELSELAQATQHEGDTYFDGNDLGAWQLWYSLDNDTDKYEWADAENGKGVIYRMIDEKNNDCPYDFKNILFYTTNYTINATSDNYYYTFSYVISGVLYDGTIEKRVTGCRNNSMGVCIASGKSILNGNIFINSSFEYNCQYNKFGNSCQYNTFGGNCCSNTFEYSCQYNKFGNDCLYNTFGNNCYSNTLGYGCRYNKFGNNCQYNTFGNNCYSNTLGYSCQYNKFGDNCQNNTFGDNCQYNTFGDNCQYNTFGNSCYSNTFGYGCQYNKFGDNCRNNKFGNNCRNNKFGNDCYSNTFGNGCNDRRIDGSKLSITLNDEYYDDGTNALVPIKHPDLSTQPNILPYKFMGQYVYEQLIPIEFKAGAWVIPKDAKTSIHLFDMSILKVSILCKYEGKLIPMSVNGISYGTEEGVYLDTDMKINGKSITYNYNAYAHIVYTSMPEEGGYYYNSATQKGILVKANVLSFTLRSMYDGNTLVEPVLQAQGHYYDIPSDYDGSGSVGFGVSSSLETVTVQYYIPDIGETGTLEYDNVTEYIGLPGELIDKAKQYLVIITIE